MGAGGLLARAGSAAVKANGSLTEGDAAILRFLAAAEILETDLWQQYNELGGSRTAKSRAGAATGATPTR